MEQEHTGQSQGLEAGVQQQWVTYNKVEHEDKTWKLHNKTGQTMTSTFMQRMNHYFLFNFF